MPSMIWTVIPRGVKNGSLTLGIYITPSQGDTSFLSLPLDGTQGTNVWTQWYANRAKDLLAGINPGGSIKLLINGNIVSDALTFMPLSATQQESSSAAATWPALLCYKQPDWDDQSTGGPKPKADCDSGAKAAAKVPSPRPYGEPVSAGDIYSASASGKTKAVSSHLYKLHEHVGNLSATAAVGAVMRRTPTAEGQATAIKADTQVTLRMNDLAILQPVDSRIGARAPAPGPNAIAFKTWLGTELVSNPTTGQVAQRNLYRLSDDPYHRLQEWVFPIVQTLAQNPNAYTDSNNDATRRQARFVQHAIFHRRCQPPKLGSQSAPPAPAPVAALPARQAACTPVTVGDFYRTLTLLARFPEWLQRLGFSYTVTVPIPGGTTLTTVALTGLPSLDSTWANIAPITQCTSTGFAAALPNGIFKYQDNLLVLDPATTKLVDNDVDGSALRVVQHSNSLQLSSKATSPALSPDMNPPDPAVVTSLSSDTALPTRSIGISLLHTEHNQHQEACIKNQYNLRQMPGAPVVGLVDLIRGYAPEVKIGGKWISLTRREVTYNDETKALSQPYALIHLEAAVHDDTPSSTSDIGSVPDLHVPQALFRWNGWSLTVPSPFPVAPATCTAKNNAPKFPIKATYRAASGSLVRLRFGAEYPLRVRLVDLLGEVMEGRDDVPAATQKILYLRHDPVPPPELLLEGDINGSLWPGETMTTLIVRDDETNHLPRRCLCPSLATLDLLLQHGVLDAPHAIFSKNGFLDLNEIGSFQDVFIDADSGEFPLRTVTYSDGTHQVSSFEPPIALPSRTYLPDPMAGLVQPEILDLATQNVFSDFPAESFYGTERKWPNAHRLRVQMDSVFSDKPYAGWRTDPIDKVRTLMVSVPKGWQIKLRLKSVPGADKAKLFAAGDIHAQSLSYLQKLFPGVSLPDVDTIHGMLGVGALSQYTPPLELILIHAVRRPLKSSTLQAPVAPPHQDYDSPTAVFTTAATIGDRRSTGKIELTAAWNDLVDTDPVLGTKNVGSKAQLAEYSLNTTLPPSGSIPKDTQNFTAIAHTFPDTRCRTLSLSADSVSRFTHYYPEARNGETPYTYPDPTPQQMTLLSTSRPAAPSVVTIIPLLPKRSSRGHHLHTQTREGGAFRIYLNRPWFSSGFGEMLGVVLWGEDPNTPAKPNFDSANTFVPNGYHSWDRDQTLEPFVTRWGADPSGDSTVGSFAPHLSEFISAPDARGNDTPPPKRVQCAYPAEMLAGLDDTNPQAYDPNSVRYVSLAAYPVAFQPRSQLWYADVQLKSVPAYNTFVRFALTRYQPNSKVNRECSPIIIAGFAQMMDGRELVLQSLGAGQMSLTIRSMRNSVNGTGMPNSFKVSLEHRRDGKWLPADPRPAISVPAHPVVIDGQNRVEISYTFYIHHPHRPARLVVEELETWFADNPTNRGLRTVRKVPRPIDIFHLPFGDD